MSTGSAPFGGSEFNQFGPLFIYWPVTWWEAFRSFLKADTRLAGLSEVYLRRTGRNPAYPFLVVTPIQGLPTVDNSSDYWSSWDVQISVLSYDDVEADTLGRTAYRVLAPKALNDDGTIGPRLRIACLDGYEMGATPGWERLVEQEAKGPGNRNIWAFHFQYTFLVGRSMVELTG
jgi:hypothetical protein